MTADRIDDDGEPPPSVLGYIDDLVQSGKLAPGGQLPTERALTAMLGRSRHDIRGQLNELAAQGRVRREVGRGTFLTVAGESVFAHRALSPSDLIEARLAWEPNLMPLVAVAATADDFETILRCLDGADTTNDPEKYVISDIAFHQALARATHNSVVVVIDEMVETGRRQLTWGELDRRRYTKDNCATYRAEHREIAYAIIDRDAVRATAAMRAHLETVRRHLLADFG